MMRAQVPEHHIFAVHLPIGRMNGKEQLTMSRRGKRADSSADKRAIVLGTENKNRKPLITFLTAVALFCAFAVYSVTQNGVDGNDLVAGDDSAVAVAANHVAYPVSLFDDGKARHSDYKHKTRHPYCWPMNRPAISTQIPPVTS